GREAAGMGAEHADAEDQGARSRGPGLTLPAPMARRAPLDVLDDRLGELQRGEPVAARYGARPVVQHRVDERPGFLEQRVALVEAPAFDLQRLAAVAPRAVADHALDLAGAEVDRHVAVLLEHAELALRARRYA